jgi:hypothetical protein
MVSIEILVAPVAGCPPKLAESEDPDKRRLDGLL